MQQEEHAIPSRRKQRDTLEDAPMKMAMMQSFKGYRISSLPRDITAGVVVAALTIPIAMGYAQIAGLPAIYGLYASILPTAIYAVVTGSRRIVFSMDSAASAATGSMVAAAGLALGSPDAARFVPSLTLVAAAFLVLFALIRAGRLISHVPIPVMHGFLAGISVMVIIDQIPLLIGTHVSLGSDSIANIASIGMSIPSFDTYSLILGTTALAAILVLQHTAQKIPSSLLILAVAMVLVAVLHLDSQGVTVLGAVSSDLPTFSIPDFSDMNIGIVGYGFVVAMVVAVESLLTLDTFAMHDGIRAHEDRELISFGIANAVSSLAGCSPCSASLSRTAAGDAAGGNSQVVSLVAASTIAIAIAFLSPCLYYLPQPVLGAIVIAALVQVIDFKKIRRYARHIRGEFFVFLIVASAVMVFGALVGVLLGVLISFGELFYRKHHLSRLGFLGIVPNKEGYKLLDKAPEAQPVAETTICRLTGELSFVNVNMHVDEMSRKADEGAKTLIIDITQVSGLDTTATDRIIQFFNMLHARHIEVRLVRSVAPTIDGYTRFEIEHIMETVRVYPSIDAALENLPASDERLVEETVR